MAARPTLKESPFWRYRFGWLPGREAVTDAAFLERCASLYSEHYGKWGPGSGRDNQRVKTSRRRLAEVLDRDDVWIAWATLESTLVGYSISVRFDVRGKGRVMWVSQLVVHETHRNNRVGTQLLYCVWQFSGCYAWGLATANPLAVRALETATRRPCRSSVIRELGAELLPDIARHVDYVPETLAMENDRTAPKVNTGFFLDLETIPQLRDDAARKDRRWDLGTIEPGQEWLACTFSSQGVSAMSEERLEQLFHGADGIWIDAYERMTLDEDHGWRSHAESEVAFLIAEGGLTPGERVLDVGCGDGRHTALLAAAGIDVVACDISRELVRRASERVPRGVVTAVLDARTDDLGGPYSAIACLYDVLGSSADREEDITLLRNLGRNLRPDGVLVLSVMNATYTLDRLADAHRPKDSAAFLEALEALPPSNAMESTGAIFDLDRILVYGGVHYRKEQFERSSTRLPVELVIRDRRYSAEELRAAFAAAGMPDPVVRPVALGHWDEPLDERDERAKELLAVWRAPEPAATHGERSG